MKNLYDVEAPDTTVSLDINSDLLKQAKKYRIDLSKKFEELLVDIVGKKHKTEQKENDYTTIKSQETYNKDEKKLIMDKLNRDRIARREELEKEKAKHILNPSGYTKEEKEKILKELNKKRLKQRELDKIKNIRTHKKEIYNLVGREFYKFTNMDRGYFIEKKDMEALTDRPTIVTMYYRVFEEMHKKDMLLKLDTLNNKKVLISHDAVRVYFKSYALEDEKLYPN